MLGSEVPDLATTPCPGCGELVPEGPDLRWDPWHPGDVRLAAAPYHLECARAAGILPPPRPGPEHERCGRCAKSIAPEALAVGYAALQRRFLSAKGSLLTPELVWRVASRQPRRYVAEHFACVLAAVSQKPAAQPADEEELPQLGGE